MRAKGSTQDRSRAGSALAHRRWHDEELHDVQPAAALLGSHNAKKPKHRSAAEKRHKLYERASCHAAIHAARLKVLGLVLRRQSELCDSLEAVLDRLDASHRTAHLAELRQAAQSIRAEQRPTPYHQSRDA